MRVPVRRRGPGQAPPADPVRAQVVVRRSEWSAPRQVHPRGGEGARRRVASHQGLHSADPASTDGLSINTRATARSSSDGRVACKVLSFVRIRVPTSRYPLTLEGFATPQSIHKRLLFSQFIPRTVNGDTHA